MLVDVKLLADSVYSPAITSADGARIKDKQSNEMKLKAFFMDKYIQLEIFSVQQTNNDPYITQGLKIDSSAIL